MDWAYTSIKGIVIIQAMLTKPESLGLSAFPLFRQERAALLHNVPIGKVFAHTDFRRRH